jgi:hypothetical protein
VDAEDAGAEVERDRMHAVGVVQLQLAAVDRMVGAVSGVLPAALRDLSAAENVLSPDSSASWPLRLAPPAVLPAPMCCPTARLSTPLSITVDNDTNNIISVL